MTTAREKRNPKSPRFGLISEEENPELSSDDDAYGDEVDRINKSYTAP